MHKHCNLDKWQIMKYTYPQVQELLAQCNKYIQFEVEIAMAPAKAMFGGGGGDGSESTDAGDTDYHEATEDDINTLARILGGG